MIAFFSGAGNELLYVAIALTGVNSSEHFISHGNLFYEEKTDVNIVGLYP